MVVSQFLLWILRKRRAGYWQQTLFLHYIVELLLHIHSWSVWTQCHPHQHGHTRLCQSSNILQAPYSDSCWLYLTKQGGQAEGFMKNCKCFSYIMWFCSYHHTSPTCGRSCSWVCYAEATHNRCTLLFQSSSYYTWGHAFCTQSLGWVFHFLEVCHRCPETDLKKWNKIKAFSWFWQFSEGHRTDRKRERTCIREGFCKCICLWRVSPMPHSSLWEWWAKVGFLLWNTYRAVICRLTDLEQGQQKMNERYSVCSRRESCFTTVRHQTQHYNHWQQNALKLTALSC